MSEVQQSEISLGPPDEALEFALHDYARKSLSLAQRLDYLLKDFGYKIRYNIPTEPLFELNFCISSQRELFETPQSQIQGGDRQETSSSSHRLHPHRSSDC